MKILSVTIIFVMFSWAEAKTLLLPDKSISPAEYMNQCSTEGYHCVQDFFFDSLKGKKTPLFDLLLDELDLSSSQFIANLYSRVKQILRSEPLSTNQLEQLTELMLSVESPKNDELLADLRLLERILKSYSIENEPEFLVLFKSKISSRALTEIRKLRSEILLTKVDAHHYPSFFSSKGRPIQIDLLKNHCRLNVSDFSLSSVKWVGIGTSCRELLSSKRNVENSSIEYVKPTLLVLGAIVTGYLLLNQYDLSIDF